MPVWQFFTPLLYLPAIWSKRRQRQRPCLCCTGPHTWPMMLCKRSLSIMAPLRTPTSCPWPPFKSSLQIRQVWSCINRSNQSTGRFILQLTLTETITEPCWCRKIDAVPLTQLPKADCHACTYNIFTQWCYTPSLSNYAVCNKSSLRSVVQCGGWFDASDAWVCYTCFQFCAEQAEPYPAAALLWAVWPGLHGWCQPQGVNSTSIKSLSGAMYISTPCLANCLQP